MNRKIISNIIKIVFVLMVILRLIAEHVIHSELLEAVSFYAIAAGFVFLILEDKADERKKE